MEGGEVAVRKMQDNGVRKLQNIGLLWAKVRMFVSKKSDVFVFRKRGKVWVFPLYFLYEVSIRVVKWVE